MIARRKSWEGCISKVFDNDIPSTANRYDLRTVCQKRGVKVKGCDLLRIASLLKTRSRSCLDGKMVFIQCVLLDRCFRDIWEEQQDLPHLCTSNVSQSLESLMDHISKIIHRCSSWPRGRRIRMKRLNIPFLEMASIGRYRKGSHNGGGSHSGSD